MTRSNAAEVAPFALRDLPISSVLALLFPLVRQDRPVGDGAEADDPTEETGRHQGSLNTMKDGRHHRQKPAALRSDRPDEQQVDASIQ